MKLPVYKIALTALIGLALSGTNGYAQQAPAAPAAPSVAAIPAAPRGAINAYSSSSSYSYSAPAQVYAIGPDGDVYNFNSNNPQDSVLRKKMQKVQEQMRDLQREMNSLRVEENKQRTVEYQKRNAERMKEYDAKFKDFDKKFADKFSNFGQKFNFERNDGDLDKKVQSGEVKLKTKAYAKSYTVDANDKIQIDNRFGKVTINVWNKNEVKVDVEIKAYGDDDDKTKELLDQVNISDSKNNDGVSFITKIGDDDHKSNFWGTMTSNGKTSVRKTVVNYTVYMPSKNALSISNSYGAVILPDLSGKLSIKNKFGNLSAKVLSNIANDITVQYGNADIESLNGGDLNISFGALNLQSADKLNAEIKYSPAKIGKLSTSGTINLHFGEGLQITNLDKNLKALSINSSYAPVKLGSLANDNADFDVTTHYGGFTYDNGNVSVTSKSPSDEERSYSTTKTYKGHVGKGSSDKVITIKSSFSSVKFDQ